MQRGGDFAQFDAEPAQFDLIVVAAEILQCAIGAPAGDIAAAVHACAWLLGEWIGDEAFGGQVRTTEISARQLRPGDVQFAGHAHRRGLPVGIEHVQTQMRDWLADRHTPVGGMCIVGGGGVDRAADHGLGRAVFVDQTGVRCEGLPTGQRGRR